jgi:thioredoxin reductase (NADPH)
MTSISPDAPLIIYGASWCPDCRRAKAFLAAQRVPYTWVDLESQPDQVAEVERRNDGKRIIPTIVFPDGTFLAEPSNDELADKIGLSRSAERTSYDLVIVGGGPTGLTTAIYAARENAKVLIVEKSAPGGQAGVTERFDNYPGFPDGVGGAELADRITRQARRYGVEILEAVGATSVNRVDNMIRTELSTGEHVTSPAVLIATGSTYRRTEAEGEADLIGAGIHFCATCDGPFYNGADNLTIVGRRQQRARGGPLPHPVRRLRDGRAGAAHPDGQQVAPGQGAGPPQDGRAGQLLGQVLQRRRRRQVVDRSPSTATARSTSTPPGGPSSSSGSTRTRASSTTALEEDARGFLVTDHMFNTSVEGIFAAGDVRSGSTKQIASAVGEGAAVAIQIRYFLEQFQESLAMHS